MTPYIFPGLNPIKQRMYTTTFNQQARPVDIATAAEFIFEALEVNLSVIKSTSRKREFVEARQLAMYLIHKHMICSLKSIGNHFGGRDHSTVIYAINTVNDLLDTDAKFKLKVDQVEKKLLSNFNFGN